MYQWVGNVWQTYFCGYNCGHQSVRLSLTQSILNYFAAVKKLWLLPVLILAVGVAFYCESKGKPRPVVVNKPVPVVADTPSKKMQQLYYMLDTLFTTRSLQNGAPISGKSPGNKEEHIVLHPG